MNFDNSFIDTCAFCEQEIELSSVSCLDCDKKFCNLCCAKLYNDNIRPINIDMTNYRRLYQQNNLSSLAKRIYEKIETLFEMLPLYIIPSNMDHTNAKNNYMKLFIH